MNAREFDLSAMRRPDRTAGVALPPRPRPVTQPSNEPEAARQVSETPAPQAAAPTRRRSPRTASADSDGRLVIALPIPLRDRARAYAASHGYTYADVCLEAIETHHEHLSDLVDALRATSSGAETGVLFERRPTARATTPTTQVTIRGISAHDRKVLDSLVDQAGARTLTELLLAVLDEHLPHRPRALR